MSATGTAAYAMYPRNVALPEVVSALNQAGFGNEDICMVLSPAHPVASAVEDATIGNVAREQSATSARVIGWFSQLGAVVIPTVGLFIRSQAFFRLFWRNRISRLFLEGRAPCSAWVSPKM